MRGREPTRDRDEAVLQWVRLRRLGWTVTQIATRCGYSGNPKDIRTLTDRVRDADLKSGHPVEVVMKAYW